MPGHSPHSTAFNWSGYLIGFGLGGFFDGILLHQILQWHHLLSLVDGVGDQLLFDGLFHAFMYVVTLVGLLLLWRTRSELAAGDSGRLLIAKALIGCGAWHMTDAIVSHWLLGIHRIKLDSPNPLLWDLLWFGLFGLLPALIGWLMHRGRPGIGPLNGRGAALGIVLAALIAGPWAAQAPPGAKSAIVMFGPTVTDGEAWNAVDAAGGDVLWRSGKAWAVRWRDEPQHLRLYEQGALLVSASWLGAGCLAWSRV